MERVISDTLEGVERAYRLVFDTNRVLMLFLKETGMPVPKPFLTAAEFVLGIDIRRALESEEIDGEKIKNILDELRTWQLVPDPVETEFTLRRALEKAMDGFAVNPADLPLLSTVELLVGLLPLFECEVNLWRIQNTYFGMAKSIYTDFFRKALKGEEEAVTWVEKFKNMGGSLLFNVGAVLPTK